MINFRSPLVQVPRPRNAIELRQAMVANALSLVDDVPPYVGLEAGNPETRKAFEELLGPGHWDLDRPFTQWEQDGKIRTQGVSTCAMVALGLLRRLRVDCTDILDGYADDIGSGLDVAIEYAMHLLDSHGAWQLARDGLRPDPGDILQVTGGMHVATVVRWEGDVCVTVDGGQVGRRGLQACALRSRMWEDRDGVGWLGSRRAVGWLVVDMLGYRDEPITVPASVVLG